MNYVRREVPLVIGVETDVTQLRRGKPSELELVVLTASDLRQAQSISSALDDEYARRPCCKLLSIDASTPQPTGHAEQIRSSANARSVASLLYDVVALGIADGAVVSIDATTDPHALWAAVAEHLADRGYIVVNHLRGWLPDSRRFPYPCVAHWESPPPRTERQFKTLVSM
ncbi:hypothetical protein [Mycolicibacterium fortuitum]|uniref:hypothetical protein n=1 Tax=Mycolicibacterium fortuitum TaxID=1766 RepID=UPI002610D70D|nr:hypothetical protein [Mycolicibacterium fortuitum]